MINIARTFALSVVSAGVIGGAAIGMAGMANAATSPTGPTGTGHAYAPVVRAQPAPEALPGSRGHHGLDQVEHFVPGYHR